MANAILFYRTPASTIAITMDPQNLPTAQKLEFTFPDNIMEGVNEQYQNNIKQIPVPNQDGSRKINIQENGLSLFTLTVNGVFNKASGAGASKLKAMKILKQVDTFHLFGIFGLEIDSTPDFNLDPTAAKGFHIQSTNIGYQSVRTTRYDFSVTLGFGGTQT